MEINSRVKGIMVATLGLVVMMYLLAATTPILVTAGNALNATLCAINTTMCTLGALFSGSGLVVIVYILMAILGLIFLAMSVAGKNN
jgi:hypothetical protein